MQADYLSPYFDPNLILIVIYSQSGSIFCRRASRFSGDYNEVLSKSKTLKEVSSREAISSYSVIVSLKGGCGSSLSSIICSSASVVLKIAF
jgi:hypothetical protein